ncbi:MAG: glycine betaine/L-proline ABC transporter substrate-binding protein ProX [Cyanobacteria bacterium SBLK]|nr:glycine betaine/L-proline ABC transporter substrate-binding protein ProX [Cyanobacteria bacterium SBLK]
MNLTVDKLMKCLPLPLLCTALLLGAIACQQPNPKNESASSSSAGLPGEGKAVQGVHANLPEEEFQTAIVNKALEKLGYEVEEPEIVTPAISFVALANGDVDYTAIHLERLHAKFYEKNGGAEKLVKSGVIISGLVQSYQIDKKTAKEYNITSLEQFKDPEIAKLFDSDRDGKADLAGCPVGWGCELAIEHHLDAYDLRDTVEHNQGEYNLIIADTITRYKEGESVLFYTWEPLWVGQVLKPGEDTIRLEVPYTDLPEEQGEMSEKDTTAKGKNLGFAIDRYWITANKEFADANPAAKKLFELIKIPVEDMSAASQRIKEGENSPEEIISLAEEWIGTNQETFDSWIEEAKQVNSEN